MNVGIFLICQKENQIGYIPYRAKTAYRNFRDNSIEICLSGIINPHHGTGINQAWRNSINIDTLWPQFLGNATDKALAASF